ncbi:hypothetical protein GALMADRAFT_229686 [Galerina marginata CBS 339.88]|uniref:Uncharacterized protein n=1 Tax=Galerina marginata (strain CBS 339.88) TaxID=685588 RepID=A0A067SXB1_GALM3|nr:hypothetical protein GALMADRAFT_229686 [Galerina marginata CBS 339.88]
MQYSGSTLRAVSPPPFATEYPCSQFMRAKAGRFCCLDFGGIRAAEDSAWFSSYPPLPLLWNLFRYHVGCGEGFRFSPQLPPSLPLVNIVGTFDCIEFMWRSQARHTTPLAVVAGRSDTATSSMGASATIARPD